MPPALVQSTSIFRSGVVNPTLAFASNLAAGNLAVVTLTPISATSSGASWSVGGSAAAALAVANTSPTFDFLYLRYAANTAAGAHTVQWTMANNDAWMTVAEFSGVATASPLDQTSDSGAASASATTFASAATPTLAAAGELVVALAHHTTSLPGGTVSATTSGFTNRQQNIDYTSAQSGTLTTGLSPSTAGAQVAWSSNQSVQWKAVVAAFKLPAVAGGLAAGAKLAYYGGGSTEPAGALVDAYGGTPLVFNRQDGLAGTGVIPLRAGQGTNFSGTFQLALKVVVAGGAPGTTLSNRRIRLASALPTGLVLYFVAGATYLNQTVTVQVPASTGTDGAVPAGYAAVTTTNQTYDATAVASALGRSGGFVRLVLGVDSRYGGGPTGTLAVPIVVEYDEV